VKQGAEIIMCDRKCCGSQCRISVDTQCLTNASGGYAVYFILFLLCGDFSFITILFISHSQKIFLDVIIRKFSVEFKIKKLTDVNNWGVKRHEVSL